MKNKVLIAFTLSFLGPFLVVGCANKQVADNFVEKQLASQKVTQTELNEQDISKEVVVNGSSVSRVKVICKQERVTGSHIAKKTCQTEDEIARERTKSKNQVREMFTNKHTTNETP